MRRIPQLAPPSSAAAYLAPNIALRTRKALASMDNKLSPRCFTRENYSPRNSTEQSRRPVSATIAEVRERPRHILSLGDLNNGSFVTPESQQHELERKRVNLRSVVHELELAPSPVSLSPKRDPKPQKVARAYVPPSDIKPLPFEIIRAEQLADRLGKDAISQRKEEIARINSPRRRTPPTKEELVAHDIWRRSYHPIRELFTLPKKQYE